MGIYLYIATALGLFIVTQTDGKWNIVEHTLKDHSLTSIAVAGDVILAGSRDGVWRSTDKGRTWYESKRNPTVPYVRWLASASRPSAAILAGTEPAGIFISRDGGTTWVPKPEVSALRERHPPFVPPEADQSSFDMLSFTVRPRGISYETLLA